MKRPTTTGIANAGVHHVAKIVSSCNSIFVPVPQEVDLGIDAIIEFIVDEGSTGCCLAVQIKSGASYVKNGIWQFRASPSHVNYWKSHVLPVAAIIYDPSSDEAKWEDLTALFSSHDGDEGRSVVVAAPSENVFNCNSFQSFRSRFLSYSSQYSDDRHFGRALRAFSKIKSPAECLAGAKSLFAFHRNRPESWHYIISCIHHFRGMGIIRFLAVALAHVPGHGDIFWHKKNIIAESARSMILGIMSELMSRDDVLALVSAIDEGGLGRGQIGQCVFAIVDQLPRSREFLVSILSDHSASEEERHSAAILLTAIHQYKDVDGVIQILGDAIPSFGDWRAEHIELVREALIESGHIEFTS